MTTLRSFALIEKNGRYLLIREASLKWRGKWFLPGGKAEVNETPEMAVKREVQEEAGCELVLKGIFYIKYRDRLFGKSFTVFYAADIVDESTLKKTADRHSLEVSWFTQEEIRQLPLRKGLEEILDRYTGKCLIPAANLQMCS